MTGPSRDITALVALPTLREASSDLLGIVPVLRRVEAIGTIEIVASVESCRDRVARGGVGLVVVDARLEGAPGTLVAALRDRVPVVVARPARLPDEEMASRDEGAAARVTAGPRFAQDLEAAVQGALSRSLESREEREGGVDARALPALVLDASGRVIEGNRAFSRVFGEGPLAGRRVENVLPDGLAARAGLVELLADAEAGGGRSRTAALEGAGGLREVYELRASRLGRNGRLLLEIFRSTEIATGSGRLGEPSGLAEQVLETMNGALLVVDREGLVVFANAAAARILGVADPRGSRIERWLRSAPLADGPVGRALSEGTRSRGAETLLTRGDASVVPIGVSCAPIDDPTGARIGAAVLFQDLSGIQALQRQALEKEKLASVGRLAGGIAHEINNPTGFIHANLLQMGEYLCDLRRILGEARALAEAVRSGDAGAARERAETLVVLERDVDAAFLIEDFGKAIRESQEGSERIRHIVQDLRDFARSDSGESVLADLNACLESTANIAYTMMKHRIVLRRAYGEIPRLRCRPAELRQVFMNLLLNAHQAIVEKACATDEVGEIRLVTALRDGEIAIEVNDTGVGIDPTLLGRIFDPFFTTRPVGAGTGLGLSTSFGIVQRHGGRIEVRSEPGVGSSFEIRLPITAREGEEQAA